MGAGSSAQLTVVVSCGDRGPFGLEILLCLWVQGEVDMLCSPLECLYPKYRSFPCQVGPCCSLYWGAQGGEEGQWRLCCGQWWWLNPLWGWSCCLADSPALQLCQHLMPSSVMVQKLWPWGDVCSKMVALMETFM